MAQGTEMLPDAWKRHLQAYADELADSLAAKAADEFRIKVKRELVGSISLLLERTMDISRLRDDLHVVIHLKDKP